MPFCRKFDAIRKCVDHNLKDCDESTPSDIVNSMLMAVRKATPCQQVSSRWFTATSGSAGIPSAHTAFSLLGCFVTVLVLKVKLSVSQ